MTEELRLNLLGTPQLLRGGQPLTGFATSKAQALLFYLAVMAQASGEPAVVHSRETLTTLLWGEMPEVKARRNLRAVLPDLRRLVGDYLQIDRQSITFDTDRPFELDVQQFLQLSAKPFDLDAGKRPLTCTRVNFWPALR
jgi:DNA-binding SARP family transcriptional activator